MSLESSMILAALLWLTINVLGFWIALALYGLRVILSRLLFRLTRRNLSQ